MYCTRTARLTVLSAVEVSPETGPAVAPRVYEPSRPAVFQENDRKVSPLPINELTCCVPMSVEVVRLLSTTEKLSIVEVLLVTKTRMVEVASAGTLAGKMFSAARSCGYCTDTLAENVLSFVAVSLGTGPAVPCRVQGPTTLVVLHGKVTLVTVFPANELIGRVPISVAVVRLLSTTEKLSVVEVSLVTITVMVALLLPQTRGGPKPVTARSRYCTETALLTVLSLVEVSPETGPAVAWRLYESSSPAVFHANGTLVTVLPANELTGSVPMSVEVVRLLSTTEKLSTVAVLLVTATRMVEVALAGTAVGVMLETARS